jgi:ubiquinone/menaquinone biosynthesis C-methylase UbiE
MPRPVSLHRVDEPEWMDAPIQDPTALAGNLDDLRRVNAWLGGTWLTRRALEHTLGRQRAGAKLSVLDVATGGADIPDALLAWARRGGLRAHIVASDVSPAMLALARRRAGPGLGFAVADGRRLPFADRSFDVATCSLALHHLRPDDAVIMLREMHRVARCAVIVNDLVRGWPWYAGAWALTRVLTRNPLTRHDAPLSVHRAYTRAEMAELAQRADLGPVTFHGFMGYRVTMTANRTP